MKIDVGFSRIEEIKHLVENGADEFHCGLVTTDEEGFFNHRPNNEQFSLKGIEELKKAIEIVHEKNRRINLLINEPSYPVEKHKNILNLAEEINGLGIDGFVVAGLSLIKKIKKINKNIILSSTLPLFNSKAFEFVEKLGVSRVTLPQHLNHNEIKGILNKTKAETEMFFLKANFCSNIDGVCCLCNSNLYTKIAEYEKGCLGPCGSKFKSSSITSEDMKREKNCDEAILSDLYYNIKNGVNVLKIGCRGLSSTSIRMLKQAKTLIELAEKSDENEFVRKGLEII